MPKQARGPAEPVRGAHGRLPKDEGFLGSSFLVARAPDTVDLVLGPRALELGRLLGEEEAEAPPGLRLLRRTEGEAARGTAQGGPLQR